MASVAQPMKKPFNELIESLPQSVEVLELTSSPQSSVDDLKSSTESQEPMDVESEEGDDVDDDDEESEEGDDVDDEEEDEEELYDHAEERAKARGWRSIIDEESNRYIQSVRDSDGFDVACLPNDIIPCGMIYPYLLQDFDEEQIQKFTGFCKAALDQFNKTNEEKEVYNFKSLEKI